MTRLDWLALALVALAALAGARTGFVASLLSTAGIVAGALAGARLAPHLLPDGESPYTPLVGLAGAAVGALVLHTVGSLAGEWLRDALRVTPLRALDAAGGLVLGAAAGCVLVWVLGAAALHFPGERELRREVQRSYVLRRLNEMAPPARLMEAIERVDPFPSILVGPRPPAQALDPSLLGSSAVRAAAPSVVRVVGTACGLAVSGSGWVASEGVVVTAAHVVAGQQDTTVEPGGGGVSLEASAIAFDARNDIAILRVGGLRARPLPLGDAASGDAVALLGYPEGGPLTATAGRVGRTVTVLAPNAYGTRPVRRSVTGLRGDIRRGNSGGPAVNGRGEVEATVFAARATGGGGYGVPSDVVQAVLAGARGRVSTGACAG